MCHYKAGVLLILMHTVLAIITAMFYVVMYMWVGGSYPSIRYDIAWQWSLSHIAITILGNIFTSMLIYRQVLSISSSRLCFILLGLLCLSSCALTATIWPPITKEEFSDFIALGFKERRDVPPFMEWFQLSQGCCGVENYTDYIRYGGTQIITKKASTDAGSSNLGDKVIAEVFVGVVFEVPRSCCALQTRNDRFCGRDIPYTTDEEIELRVSSLAKGCYQIFQDTTQSFQPVQISMMFHVFRIFPIIDACLHFGGLIVYSFYFNQLIRSIHARDDAVFYGKLPPLSE